MDLRYDEPGPGWRLLGFPSLAQFRKQKQKTKKRDMSERVKSGLLHGLGKFRLGLNIWQHGRQSVATGAFAGGAGGSRIVNGGRLFA